MLERTTMKLLTVIGTSAALFLVLTNGEGVRATFDGLSSFTSNFTEALMARSNPGFTKA